MSNNLTLVSRSEIELLTSEMSIAPLSDEEYSTLISFVGKILITDSTLVNEYGLKYQKEFAELSSEITNAIQDNKDIKDTQNLIDTVLSIIKSIDEYKSSNPNLYPIKLNNAKNKIEKLSSILKRNKLLLEKNLNTFNILLNQVKKCEYWISMYILAGKVRLKQIDILLALYRQGDKSRIKNDASEAIVQNCYKVFEDRLTSLISTRIVCMQSMASIKIQIQNNQSTIEMISSIIGVTIPSFKHAKVLSSY